MFVAGEKWRNGLAISAIRVCKDKKELQAQVDHYLQEAENCREHALRDGRNRGLEIPLTQFTGSYFIYSVEKDGSLRLARGLMIKMGLRPLTYKPIT